MGNMAKDIKKIKVSSWLLDNMVTLFFIAFTIFGFIVAEDLPFIFFLNELSARVFRNSFLVLSLIIPVTAGLGLNFGIVVGAMAGQIAIIIVRYFNIGGLVGLLICILLAIPFSLLIGYLTGVLYNKTRGQEMIASLIVGFFANGIYQFIFLFAIGVIIKVSINNPLIIPSGIGIRTTIDMNSLAYVIDGIFRAPLMWATLVIASVIFFWKSYKYIKNKNSRSEQENNKNFVISLSSYFIIIGVSLYTIIINSSVLIVKVPVVTLLLIVGLCFFTESLMKTKIGQDFRSVGNSQHVADVSGIDVDRKRIVATIISTLLAAWGQIIYLQSMGTLNTYGSHSQTGIFAVASLLVGGASLAKANYKHALIGTILFNSMFIMSPEIGKAVLGNVLLGEYFRSFMVYGVISFALVLYVWKNNKRSNNIA